MCIGVWSCVHMYVHMHVCQLYETPSEEEEDYRKGEEVETQVERKLKGGGRSSEIGGIRQVIGKATAKDHDTHETHV